MTSTSSMDTKADNRRKKPRQAPYGGIKSVLVERKTRVHSSNTQRRHVKVSVAQTASSPSLSLQRFLSLPQCIIARVCRFFGPVDLLSLTRTSKSLRAFFMSRNSKLCWDEARHMQGIPDWRTVATPQVMVFLFSDTCQGEGCDEPAELETFHLCRRYCSNCAEKNLMDSGDVSKSFPGLPENLLSRLPWTKNRSPKMSEDVQSGRYYLKADVSRLWRRFRDSVSRGPSAVKALERELLSIRRERAAATAVVKSWYNKQIRHRRQASSERWDRIRYSMQKRWGWAPTDSKELSPALKPLVDYLINAPSLTEEVWVFARGDMIAAIRAGKAKGKNIVHFHSVDPFQKKVLPMESNKQVVSRDADLKRLEVFFFTQ